MPTCVRPPNLSAFLLLNCVLCPHDTVCLDMQLFFYTLVIFLICDLGFQVILLVLKTLNSEITPGKTEGTVCLMANSIQSRCPILVHSLVFISWRHSSWLCQAFITVLITQNCQGLYYTWFCFFCFSCYFVSSLSDGILFLFIVLFFF